MLRSALPLVKDNEQLYGMALFHWALRTIGWRRRARIRPRLPTLSAFQSRPLPSRVRLQAQAAKNVKVMQQEFERVHRQ